MIRRREEIFPWLDAKSYYRDRWGRPVGRVGVDAGFSCPNRGTNRGNPGCTFCSEAANRPPYQAGATDLADQIARGKRFQRERYGTSLYSLYFQSFSSTWAPVSTLKEIYDRGLAEGEFVDLTVGTRPDCVPDPVADLLADYQRPDLEVWVELGLQSSREETLARINRGHDVAAFRSAAGRLRDRGLKFTTHMMFGLPGESVEAFVESVAFALAEGTSGLKFHDLVLVPGTALYQDWLAGRQAPVDPEAYLEAVVEALAVVPPDVVVWRVQSDVEDRQGSPVPGEKWSKNRFLNLVGPEVLKRRGSQSR